MKRLCTALLVAVLALAANHAQAQSPNFAGTKWAGAENLAGFGKLAFHLHDGGKATMIDAQETSHGNWSAQPNSQVVLSFYNGQTKYVGLVNGKEMKGSASNGKTTWDWQVVNSAPVVAASTTRTTAGTSSSKPPSTPAAP